MNYHQYILSPQWQAKRAERFAIDDGKCVVCKQPATEVHHLTYEQLGNEDVLHTLVSVCAYCHRLFDDVERFFQYRRRRHAADTAYQYIRREVSYGMAIDSIQPELVGPLDYALQSARRSTEPILEGNQEDFQQTLEDGQRLRRDGAHRVYRRSLSFRRRANHSSTCDRGYAYQRRQTQQGRNARKVRRFLRRARDIAL